MDMKNIIIGVVMLLTIIVPIAYLSITQNKKNKKNSKS